MKHQVFIDGGEGTTGLKIHEYFQSCEDIEVLTIQEEKEKRCETSVGDDRIRPCFLFMFA